MIKEFRDFLFRGNIVELAVAFVMGLAFAALINSLVNNLLTPVIAMIIGKPNFNDLTFTINDAVFPLRRLPDRPDPVRRHRRGRLLLHRQAGERSAGAVRFAGRRGHAGRGAPAPGAARRPRRARAVSVASCVIRSRRASWRRRDSLGSGLAMKHDALMQDLTPAGETRGSVSDPARKTSGSRGVCA
jgi:hypothetical protein